MSPNRWNRIARGLSEADCIAARDDAPPVEPCDRQTLEAKYGQVWDTWQLAREFEVEAFTPRLVVAHRRADGVRGTLVWQSDPRFYWSFQPA